MAKKRVLTTKDPFGFSFKFMFRLNISFYFAVLFGFVLSCFMSAQPVVPGYERLKNATTVPDALLGEVLMGELNCISCHSATETVAERLYTKPAPDLSEVGRRVTPQYLKDFILDPQGVKPGTTMPGVFHSSAPMARQLASEALTHFLVSLGGPIPEAQTGGAEYLVEQGRDFFHTLGCVACHAPEETESDFEMAVPLDHLARKTTLDALVEFLMDPIKIRHGGRMPNLRLDTREARSLAVYLLREQLSNPLSKMAGDKREPGVKWTYYESEAIRGAASLKDLTPVAEGVSETFTLDISHPRREQNFGIVFEGLIEIPSDGEYRFTLNSDDGSVLYVNGGLLVDNDGDHAPQRRSGRRSLEKGMHEIALHFYNRGGGYELGVTLSGPGIDGEKEIGPESLWRDGGMPMIPVDHQEFVLNPSKIEMGKQMFDALRCASCHALPGRSPMIEAKPLMALNADSNEGCLGEQIRKGVPDYDFAPDQLRVIRAALASRAALETQPSPEERLQHTIAALNCYACHERGNVGGVIDDRKSYFTTTTEIDLGDEGRFPPTLNHAGYKLKPDALKSILVEDDLHVRYYMTTRMPSFGPELAARVSEALIEVDAKGNGKEPAFSEESWKVGHQLIGVKGLACVTCHGVAGEKGLGIPGIDLATVYDRIQPGWFLDFLQNPAQFNKDTRMPMFWPGGMSPFPDLADGDAVKQMKGIWNYLSLRKSMPLPAGIVPQGTVGAELIPAQETIVHRTFMKGVGPRTILAGYPEKVNVAFDANQVRLAKAWRGRFFDASGVASGRSDTFMDPLGQDVIDMPEGPSFAFLDDPHAPWILPKQFNERDVGGLTFKGYELDETGQPSFKYELSDVSIIEKPIPKVQPGGTILIRTFTVSSKAKSESLYFLAARGDIRFEDGTDSFWVDDKIKLTIKGDGLGSPEVRGEGDNKELLIPISLSTGHVDFSVTTDW